MPWIHEKASKFKCTFHFHEVHPLVRRNSSENGRIICMKQLQSILVSGCLFLNSCSMFPARTSAFAVATPAEATPSAALQPTIFSTEFVGMHTLSPGRHWPTVPFGSIRTSGTSWGALEPEKGKFDWHSLDTWVSQAQAHHVGVDYIFLNTPQWASTRPTESCNNGPHGCAAPPNPADWEEFVTAIVTRYKGKISSYELWNEPNVSGYWTGTPQQMVDMASKAYRIIKSVDPNALVVSPSASSTGWPAPADAWLDQYLSAGGGKYADVIGWHGYSGRNDRPALPPEDLVRQIRVMKSVLAKHHLSNMPLWNTEGGWGKNAQLPSEDQQADFLVKWYLIQFTNGISRAYWYQWDNTNWGTLWSESKGLTPAGGAMQQVYDWLRDTTASTPCRQTGASLWSCDLKKGNVQYRAVWSASGTVPYPDAQKSSSFVQLGSSAPTQGGKPVSVGSRPVFFRLN